MSYSFNRLCIPENSITCVTAALAQQIVMAPVEKLSDGFEKAVVFRTLREREQAIHSLRRGGVHVLDVEPERLTARLVSHFIELRQSNLL